MGNSRDTDSSPVMEGGCTSGDDTRPLLLALQELLHRLSVPREGGSESVLEDVERWEDGEYLYVEAGLMGSDEAEIDVCIQGGRAFLRIAR